MTELSASAAKVQAAAASRGLSISVREMDQPTRTADEAAAACGVTPGQIVKSLVFVGADSNEPYLLLVSGTNRVNEKAMSERIGERLKRAEADYVRTLTGFAIGGIPPFGHAQALATFIDEDLLRYDIVWAAAGTPRAVFAIEPRALAEAARAKSIAMS